MNRLFPGFLRFPGLAGLAGLSGLAGLAGLLTPAVLLAAGDGYDAVQYSAVPDNVSYDEVLSLDSGTASETLYYGSDPLQYGSLWLPTADQGEPRPLVVFIHGGCWLNSFDMQHAYPFLTALVQEGFAVWSLEYRRSGDPGGGWPGTYEDIRAGIDHIKVLNDYGIDHGAVAIVGHSAGGHLALLAGGEHREARLIVGLAAITDIIEYGRGDNSCQTATAQFMGAAFDSAPDRYRTANPADREPHPNTILMQGTLDQIVPVSQARLEGTSTMLLDGAGHFDWIHPGSRGFSELVDLLRESLSR